MQSHEMAQKLTIWDRFSVILYRTGIVVMAVLVVVGGLLMTFTLDKIRWEEVEIKDSPTLFFYFLSLYLFSGISVVTIHLYAKRFRHLVRVLYLVALAGGIGLYIISGGSPIGFFLKNPLGPVLFFPLAGTMGFIGIKEAFCFRFIEGYILAILLPAVLVFVMLKTFSPALTGAMIVFVGFVFCYLAWHKLRMPIGYDIGNKDLYER